MIEPTQADIDLADEIAAAFGHGERERPWLAELIARARIEGAERMREAAVRVAKSRRAMWSCAGGFEGHTSGANVIASDILALSPADVVKERNDG